MTRLVKASLEKLIACNALLVKVVAHDEPLRANSRIGATMQSNLRWGAMSNIVPLKSDTF